jgi:hypothetical protein
MTRAYRAGNRFVLFFRYVAILVPRTSTRLPRSLTG